LETTSDTRQQTEVTVITVDDHAAFRQVAHDVIAATPGFEPIGEAESGEDALRLVGEVAPALVLLDMHMPGMDGIETARHIGITRPEAVIVLITIEDLEALPTGVAFCSAAAVARKQDLCPQMLARLWEAHGPHPRSQGRA
jgi:two-component system, NarL family, invasion response regulator UvrY